MRKRALLFARTEDDVKFMLDAYTCIVVAKLQFYDVSLHVHAHACTAINSVMSPPVTAD